MIDTQSIRTKILDLAMRGQLTDQLPEDGTAEELYQQIQAEKQALIKAGKIKKENPLPEITEGEMPFEIPANWKWVAFGNIITLQSGQDLKPEEYNSDGKGIPYLTGASNFNGVGNLIINRWTEQPKNIALKDDVLLSCKGTVGKLAILNAEKVHIARQFMAIRSYKTNVMFTELFMMSVIEGLKKAQKGLIPGIERNDVLRLVMPLPPIAEQQRIVDRVQQAFTALDTVDELQTQYADNLTVLKSKLIDAAIQGKLTEQLPEDGTAEELYHQIQEEKQELIRAGKIKKEKPLPEITENEIPFDIPRTWKWVRLCELMILMSTGPFGSMLHKSDYIEQGIPVINPANIIDGSIVPSSKMLISAETKLRLAAYELHEGMIVMGRRGEMGRCAVVGPNEDGWLCGTGSFFMKPSSALSNEYISLIISSPYAKSYLSGQSIGMTMNNLNQNILQIMPVPLPPLAEQRRIVARLDQVLAMIEV